MSLILNIDTALETANVCVAENGKVLKSKTNSVQKDHASFLHQAVDNLLVELSIEIKQLSAIAVSIGPGSYTGLRVGISSAKGFCYALNKPLLAISSLKIIANDAIGSFDGNEALICPMIDARRMEVFTALYDVQLNEIKSPSALVLNEFSFSEVLASNKIYFTGNGSPKFKTILLHENASFIENNDLTHSLAELSFFKYRSNDFDDLVATDPLYLKEYQTNS
jgi:tRNA threonylcarbamoyladenosine biosynthesis protein TsaB